MKIDTYERCGPDYFELQETAERDALTLSYVNGKKYPHLIRINPNSEEDWVVTIMIFNNQLFLDTFLVLERSLIHSN